MPTPIPLLGRAAALRPVNQTGQPPWTLISAQVFTQYPTGTTLQVERTGAQAWSIVGISIGSAPTPAQVAAALVKNGQAKSVGYIEAWAQDGRVLGTGYVTWWYIAVYQA